MKLNAQQLRKLTQPEKLPPVKRFPLYFILENIYDTYNIGGLFRLADALAVEKLYLCGECETPPNHKIRKASVGTDKIVKWEYKTTAKEAINDLNTKFKYQNSKPQSKISLFQGFENSNLFRISNLGFRISVVAVEQHPKAIPYYKATYQLPSALIFGNESFGILPETLKLADQIVEIPMFGINKSLNVIVAGAIVGYWIIINQFANISY